MKSYLQYIKENTNFRFIKTMEDLKAELTKLKIVSYIDEEDKGLCFCFVSPSIYKDEIKIFKDLGHLALSIIDDKVRTCIDFNIYKSNIEIFVYLNGYCNKKMSSISIDPYFESADNLYNTLIEQIDTWEIETWSRVRDTNSFEWVPVQGKLIDYIMKYPIFCEKMIQKFPDLGYYIGSIERGFI